jgi:hypothetical protein
LYTFVNTISTIFICLKLVFIEMFDTLISFSF